LIEAGVLAGIKGSQRQSYWRWYQAGGLKRITYDTRLGKWGACKLSSHQISLLPRRLSAHDMSSLKEICAWLQAEFK